MSNRAVFVGGRQAGCVGLLALAAARWEIGHVVAYDVEVAGVARALGLPVERSVHAQASVEALRGADLLVSVHGREIVPDALLRLPHGGGVNVHPCLYAYPGADPVGRLLADGNPRASVGVHRMTAEVDAGEVLVEEFVDVAAETSVAGVYNALYPAYARTLLAALPLAVGNPA